MMQLISKSSTGKIRVVLIEYVWDDNIQGYYIFRHSGQFNGKMTQQPTVTITEGKAGRSRKQQVELQYNHLVKEKLDKGYKIWEKPLEESTEEELQEFIGEIVTNRDSVPKPMLAKQADKVVNTKIFDKDWYASVKIDGLRILIYMGVDGELHTSSRGAMNYDPAMYEILSNPTLIEIFKKYPGIILDDINPRSIRDITYYIGRKALADKYGITIAKAGHIIGLLDLVIHETDDGRIEIVPNNVHRFK
jgi:hypothetical protein